MPTRLRRELTPALSRVRHSNRFLGLSRPWTGSEGLKDPSCGLRVAWCIDDATPLYFQSKRGL